MSVRITQQQLESYLWGAAVLLRGTIDAGDYKQFIFPLLFFKRLCDVFDEETLAALKESGGDAAFAAYPENHRFQIPPAAHWAEVRKASKNVGQALQSNMRAIEKANPEKLFGIFGDAQWTNKDRLSDAMLHDLIEHFSSQSPRACIREALGQLLEYSFWPGRQPASRLVVVGATPLNKDGKSYLKRLNASFRLKLCYQSISSCFD
jgi:type I restriction-modification system DNA methylase subunit